MAVEVNKELHEIFIVDPLHLKCYVGRYVQLTLESGIDVSGIIYTVDPVSQSIILIGSENKLVTMRIICKNLLNSMKIMPDTPEELKNLEMTDLFNPNKDRKSSYEIKKRKEKVKSWLLKNMLMVVEKGDILVLDTLEIHPPYSVESCLCSNTIVLDRVQTLLKELKMDED